MCPNQSDTKWESGPDPEEVAKQLRKPSGEFAGAIAEKMDYVNEPLYDLTLDTMGASDDDRILEIGFGSGRFLSKLFSKKEGLKVSGIDYSPEMLKMASKLNSRFIDSGNLVLELGSSNDLPYPDNTFDKIYCNMVIYFWDQPSQHLQEIRRVLKPQGRFYTGMRTKESMLKFPFVQHGFTLYSQERWIKELEVHGFENITKRKQRDARVIQQEPKIQMESVCIEARNPDDHRTA